MSDSDNNKVVPVVFEDICAPGAIIGVATIQDNTYRDLKLFTEYDSTTAWYAKVLLEAGEAEVLPHFVGDQIIDFSIIRKQ